MVSGLQERTVRHRDSDVRFQVWLPPSPTKPLPAILFLHGLNESGADGHRQAEVGIGPALEANPEDWPFLVVMPQKPNIKLWPSHRGLLKAVLAAVDAEFTLDRSRLYFTGLSQGGHGVMHLYDQLPWKFAAAAAVCGWALPKRARTIGGIPLRLYHGMKDRTVPYLGSTIVGIRARHLHPATEIILYPEASHNSWDRAYQRSGLAEWLLRFQMTGGSSQ